MTSLVKQKGPPAEADAPGVDGQTLIRRPAGYCESVVTILAIRLPRLGKGNGESRTIGLGSRSIRSPLDG